LVLNATIERAAMTDNTMIKHHINFQNVRNLEPCDSRPITTVVMIFINAYCFWKLSQICMIPFIMKIVSTNRF